MNYQSWTIPYDEPAISSSCSAAGYPPLLALLLSRKESLCGQDPESFLKSDSSLLVDPYLLKGMESAVERIKEAISAEETVAVFGDYDVDGITSTCLMTDFLTSCGLDVIPYIPDRMDEGYGLNNDAIDYFHENEVSLIITVDCGITAKEEAAYARTLGIDVIITDHHECQDGVPDAAAAVVDPKQNGCHYPNKELCGVGVALKVACAVSGMEEEMLSRYIEWTAIGTIADVMMLVGENRFIVKAGLERITKDPSPGISALLNICNAKGKKMSASSVGYTIAPRLNAAGRLGHAMMAFRLLMEQDPDAASVLAEELFDMNKRRQDIETDIWNDAQEMLAGTVPDGPIVLASEHWHPGVIGIAASRLADQFSFPSIMICLNGDYGKGSCRSYGNFNLFEALSACSEYLEGFGGHSQAAGLTIRRENLQSFRFALTQYYEEHAGEEISTLDCDLLIAEPGLLTKNNVLSLDQLEPFGNGNPPPVLCLTDATIYDLRSIGNGRHIRFRLRYEDSWFDCVFFSHSLEQVHVHDGDRVDVAFQAQINEYNGIQSVQLLITDLRTHNPDGLCRELISDPDRVLWCSKRYLPSRADFVSLWHMMQQQKGVLGSTFNDLLSVCPEDMAPETCVICLIAWKELGLIIPGPDGSVIGGRVNAKTEKVHLEDAPILQKLENQKERRF